MLVNWIHGIILDRSMLMLLSDSRKTVGVAVGVVV